FEQYDINALFSKQIFVAKEVRFMRIKKIDSDTVKLCETTKVKLKTAGNTRVVQFTAGNNKS
ncbi:MAG: hypothetical protein PUC12_06775, partial [Clostridiales bacterium]|nr:hypothetical protein [Clostridiales bacterium]